VETIPATGKNMVFLIFSSSMSEGIFFFLYSRWTPSWSDATQVVGTYLGVQLSHWTMFQESCLPKVRVFKKGNEVSELTPNKLNKSFVVKKTLHSFGSVQTVKFRVKVE
jgi:hypothetical protein